MAKPIINKIVPIDAKKENIISMSYNGELPYSNRLIIYDASTLLSVYDMTQNSYNLTHTIPADTLKNGNKYAAQAQVFDSAGNPSVLSDKLYFWTLATPLFHFSNIQNEDIINNASVYATLIYEQEDWENIAEFRFYLYDDLKNLLLESETYYTTDNLTYSYRGLNDDHFYYIRAMGITTNGIQLDTGYVRIFINYENPEEYKLIDAQCNEYNSVVTYQTNFVVINSSDASAGAPYDFYDGWIDLIDKTLVYDENFIIDGDFTISIRGTNMYRAATILKCSNSRCGFTLSSYIYDDWTMRYKLTVPNGISSYILYSEPLLPESLDIVTIHIRRINNVYQLYCFVEPGADITQNTMWFGQSTPVGDLNNYDIWIENGENGVTRVDKNNVTIFYQKDEPVLQADKKYDIWIGGE